MVIGLTMSHASYASSFNQSLRSPEALAAENHASTAPQAIVSQPVQQQFAQATKIVAPSPALSNSHPSAVDTANTVNKLLAPRQADPNVPLPQEDLAQSPSDDAPLTAPRLYGRNESANGVLGGVLGLRIPIPATQAQ
jgi:hypothetical protein